ncbi:beta-lactamase/transpeptidase-like protein [Aspergillus tetrazonus]
MVCSFIDIEYGALPWWIFSNILRPLRNLFGHLLSDGSELGASTCVEIDERNVVDLWGGYCNAERTKDWERDTITTIWSTKVNTALAANILVNRALLDPAERISTYWAEFAANGKVNILVSHVLSHSSELPSWESPNTVEDLYNAEKAAERIAAQALWWTPGEQLGYHLVTQGCFVGELVRRTTGQSLAQFITDEIANPLRSVAARAYAGVPRPVDAAMAAPFRIAELGASNALTTRGSLLELHQLSRSAAPSTGNFTEHILAQDQVLFVKLRLGLGVGASLPEIVLSFPSTGRLWSAAYLDIIYKMGDSMAEWNGHVFVS